MAASLGGRGPVRQQIGAEIVNKALYIAELKTTLDFADGWHASR
ncbi:MAG: hypothetical protein ACFCBW_22240 [Candidatus Competibacterales bacterium]